MCLPATLEMFRSLRFSLEPLNWMAMGLAAVAGGSPANRKARPLKVSHVVDLTQTLSPEFPSWPGYPSLEVRNTHNYERDGFFANAWHVHEHSGTHVDAPLHFSVQGWSAAEIPQESLVVPAVVIDIRGRVRRDPDTQVRMEDIRAWERKHGRVPREAAVLMWSGWENRAGDQAAYRNTDNEGIMHFPGFSPEAVEFLVKERAIAGIGVDTLSLDYGPSTDFGAHFALLPANRWGIENLANLGRIPSKGATLFVGVPRVQGASGGPSRILAVW
ncbi:MAG: cyclase family protein [candidate division NC10 bacterium]|nr:cyclase family protein [candidate division NC10 bacterium]